MIKKCLAVLIAAIMLLCVVSVRPGNARADMTYVRVLLSTSGQSKLTMTVTGSYTVKESARIFSGGTLTIKGSGATVTVTHSAEGELYSGKSVTIERNNLSRSAGNMRFATKYGTRFYLGHFSITSSNGVLSVVNRVPMTHYLYGVVGHEMADSWPLEALKAQAIAAKCYALLNRSSARAYDLNDTSSHQVYKGYTATNLNVIEAVDDTQSVALFYDGAVMRCYYAASNGGYMLRPSSNWTGPTERWDAAYGEGPDEYDMKNPLSPRETLFVPYTFARRSMNERLYTYLNEKIAAAAALPGVIPAGYSYTAPLRIDSIVSMTDEGNASGIDHDVAEVHATLIAALDLLPDAATPAPSPTPVPTPTPTPSPAPTPTPDAPPSAVSVSASPSPTPGSCDLPPESDDETTPAPAAFTAAQQTALTIEVPVSFRFRLEELESDAVGAFTNKSLRLIYAAPAEDGFCFMHVRYGHGVGMSQRGAEQMAYEGKTYQQILAYYYPGGTLSAIDSISPESAAAQTPAPSLPGTVATGTVQNEQVNVRAGAGSSTKSLGKLDIGAQVMLTGLFGQWYQILYAETGAAAYVHSDYIEASGSGVIARGYVASSAVNLRSGPGTTYQALGQLSKNTPIGIIGIENGWYRLVALASGQEGYMLQKYVTVTEKAVGVLPSSGTTTAAPLPSATPAITADPAATIDPAATDAPPTPMPSITPVPTPTSTPAPTVTPAPGPYSAEGTVAGNAVNLRQGASTATKSYGRLKKGEALGIYEKIGSWYRVRVLASGQDGFMYAKYVALTPAAGDASRESQGALNASAVNIRKGPGTAYTSVGRLSRGTKVSVLSSSGSWYQVRVIATGVEGYVFAKYITVAAKDQSAGTKSGIVTALINLRTLPAVGDPSRVLLTIPKGEIVTVHSNANGWCFITYRGTTGYCIASCVSIG